ncbi:tetratricopeptide repeat protein [Niveibacterium sp.]|uniref:tetratricopeptide repeat protein n=1 Tax=Niveibacterium sp. TaxID=2017444 RepID=UPI0035B0711C
MGILLLLIFFHFGRPVWELMLPSRFDGVEPPLPGSNSLSGLRVTHDNRGRWIASFNYFYTGYPQGAYAVVELPAEPGSGEPSATVVSSRLSVLRGSHAASIEIRRPPWGDGALVTESVAVRFMAADSTGLTGQVVAARIEWPDAWTWMTNASLASTPKETLFRDAVGLIDSGEPMSIAAAKLRLERVLLDDPAFDQAYVELARVAMKQNWGAEGLHQAENYLDSALRLAPDSVDAQILLGYVYAHQRRYKDAEKLFADAEIAKPDNLWLWANWGELLLMQKRVTEAEAKYRVAIAHPRSERSYDRARRAAYSKLFDILRQRADQSGIEALHRQRVSEYAATGCYAAEYAKFLLHSRADSTKAIELTKGAVDGSCNEVREVLGLAHYVAWSSAADSTEKSMHLGQARIFLPAGPRLMYLLAESERLVPTASQLIKNGEPVDLVDNERLSALAYALNASEHEVVRRLLRLGAKATLTAGDNAFPIALLPVLKGDVEGVRILLKAGVDYSQLHFQGMNGVEYARRSGNAGIAELMSSKAMAL